MCIFAENKTVPSSNIVKRDMKGMGQITLLKGQHFVKAINALSLQKLKQVPERLVGWGLTALSAQIGHIVP